MTRFLRRPLTVLTLAMGLLIATPGVAHAEELQFGGWTRTSTYGCPYAFQTMTNNYGQGRPGLHTTAYAYWTQPQYGPEWCNTAVTVEQGFLNVRQDLWFLHSTSTSSVWYSCNVGPWIPNYGVRHSVDTVFRWSTPPCQFESNIYLGVMRARIYGPTGWVGTSDYLTQRFGMEVN